MSQYPPPNVYYVQQPQKGASGFGVASLVLGIVAIVVVWIPLCGISALPIAIIGLILGVIGLLVSGAGGRSGVGMPVAGSIINVIAIGLFIVISIFWAAVIEATGDSMKQTTQPTTMPLER